MSYVRITHAWRNGELVAAESFTSGGFKPNCLCPGCSKELVAKIGRGVKEPHFAHL